jgi:hypothetical protein
MVEIGQASRQDFPEASMAKALFGGAPEGTIISKYTWGSEFTDASLRESGLRKGIQGHVVDFKKALYSTLNTYSAGTLPILIPVYVDPEVVDLTRRATPLVELVPRVTNYGNYASYNQISVIATAQAVTEDAALTEQNDTYWTEPVNSTTVSGVNSYDGLWQLISNTNSNGFGGSSSYTTDKAGAALAISDIRTAIRTARTAGGEPNLMVCDYATYDGIKALIQDQLRYVTTQNISWGITTLSFEGIPIIASRFLSTTAGNGSKTPYDGKSLFVIDTNVVEMRVLRDVTYEELAQTNLSKKFVLSVFEALVVKAPQFNHVIYDIL